MALVNDNITWFVFYSICVPIFLILFLVSFVLMTREIIKKCSLRGSKIQILIFLTLSCFFAVINNLIRGIAIAVYDVRPWILVLFIYIIHFLSGILNFDAHMTLVMLFSEMYHTTYSKGDINFVKNVIRIIQIIIACSVHVLSVVVLFISVLIVIIFRIIYRNDREVDKKLMADPGVVYAALIVLYVILTIALTASFLIYGTMLIYRIKTSPGNNPNSKGIAKLTLLTTIVVSVHFLYILAILIGSLGILLSTFPSLSPMNHFWAFVYFVAFMIVAITTTILLIFFGRNSKSKNKLKKTKIRKDSKSKLEYNDENIQEPTLESSVIENNTI